MEGFGPPGIAPDRLKILRSAFTSALKDPELKVRSGERKLRIRFGRWGGYGKARQRSDGSAGRGNRPNEKSVRQLNGDQIPKLILGLVAARTRLRTLAFCITSFAEEIIFPHS